MPGGGIAGGGGAVGRGTVGPPAALGAVNVLPSRVKVGVGAPPLTATAGPGGNRTSCRPPGLSRTMTSEPIDARRVPGTTS